MYEERPYVSELNGEERNTAMFCHLAGLCFFTSIPFAGLIAPLIIWLLKRDESHYVNVHGREVINFQISIAIYTFFSILLVFIVIGIPLLIGISLLVLVCSIIGAIKAKDGVSYRYPLTIRFL